jgi:hypothetical protein
MSADIKKAVTECGHCILGNNVSHRAQQILGALSFDEPFDVIAIDLWMPGVTTPKESFIGDRTSVRDASLTSLCNLTGFASIGFIDNLEGDSITRVLMAQIVLPNGIPKMVLLDDDSLFKNDLVRLLDDMGLPFHVVSAEQHEGILCERFHRYLNKVQRLMGLDTRDHSNWKMNMALAAYAWNGSLIDGTNVVRSFAAKARSFNFPLDVQEKVPRVIGNHGEVALQHVETVFPLWYRQKEILKLLVSERRERHTAWANKNKKRREFQPGDIVVVRRQVQSDASLGRPAKQRIKARGPYKVLEKAGDQSYWIQRVPVLQELNRKPGVRQKQAAWRLERIPSSVVVHKRMDSMDTRWVKGSTTLVDNPLEHNLGFFDFGKYHKAPNDASYAFDRAEDLLGYDLESESDSEESEDENDDEVTALSDKEAQPSSSDPTASTRASVKRSTINTDCPPTVAHLRRTLAKDIRQSKDKLFLIRRQRPSYKLCSWHLVQVDEDETNWRKAKSEGVYHVRYFVKSLADSRKKQGRHCAYWPEIHEFKRDGETMGPIVPTTPVKVERLLATKPHRYMWYQDTINLFENKIVGPFDFEPGHLVPEAAFAKLLSVAKDLDIYVGALKRVVPLDKPDFHDRNVHKTPSSHLALRWNILTGTR